MKKLREQFENIIYGMRFPDKSEMIDYLIEAVKSYFKSTGKQGGTATHTRHPEHLKTISKKGVEARKRKIGCLCCK